MAEHCLGWGVEVVGHLLSFSNIFQKRIVSSPAAETHVSPSGLSAKYNTLAVCPLLMLDKEYIDEIKKRKMTEVLPSNFATLVMLGYFQTVKLLFEYPCEDTSSL
jgi:hypothetical protein